LGKKIVLQGWYKYILCVFQRDPIEIVCELISATCLKDNIEYTPQRHFTSIKCLVQIFSEMWTGDWWWDTQASQLSNRGRETTHIKPS
jgi:hypothetical protein